MRILLAATVLIAALGLDLRPAEANGRAPWCAVISVGWGDVVWDCRYRSIEECRPNVIAGNRGFCNHNPAFVGWNAPVKRPRAHGRRHSPKH